MAAIEEQAGQAWAAALEAVHARLWPRFRRAEPRRRVKALSWLFIHPRLPAGAISGAAPPGQG